MNPNKFLGTQLLRKSLYSTGSFQSLESWDSFLFHKLCSFHIWFWIVRAALVGMLNIKAVIVLVITPLVVMLREKPLLKIYFQT